MRVLLTGAEGQLGWSLKEGLRSHEVIPFSHSDLLVEDPDVVRRVVRESRPDIIVNAAAFTRVDDCERRPETAFKANAEGPANLAEACDARGIPLVHMSTDYVFDGSGMPVGGYTEDDVPNPLNIYGKSKWEGEKRVREVLDEHFIIRTSWLYGARASPASRRNFVLKMLDKAHGGQVIKVVDDQVGSPTFSDDVATKIAAMIGSRAFGTYHVADRGQVSWYMFASEAIRISGYPGRVEPCTTEEFPTLSCRPKFSALQNRILVKNGFGDMPAWKDALARYVRDLKVRRLV
jgi:dTDP-4-dehydrorhamnose reductase